MILIVAAAGSDASGLAAPLRGLGPVAILTPALTPDGMVEAWRDAEGHHGAVDALITIPAPPAAPLSFVETSDVAWTATLDGLILTMLAARAAAPALMARRGRMAFIAWEPVEGAGQVPQAALAGAIGQFARSLAAEVGEAGVTVNAVIARPGRVEALAPIIRLLCSRDSGYLTAEVLLPGGQFVAPITASAGGSGRGLKGRVALVTGAGQGIGAAIASRLGAEGCAIAVNALHPEKAEATTVRLRDAGVPAAAFPADVSDPAQVDTMITAIEAAMGPVDVLVNNAAILEMERLNDQDLAVWSRTIAVNLSGPFLCARRVLPGMLAARWGRIVNVSSIWGLVGARGATAYSAAKGGLIGMTRALAAEVSARGPIVSAIAPGVIDTPQLAADAAFAGITLEAMKARYAENTLVGRIGTPEEIAGAVAFLASDDGMALAGQVVPVTGGRSE